MKNILYLHTGAELYGADVILLELLKGLDRSKYNPYVILPNNGPLVNEIKKLNINVLVKDYPILRRQFFTPLGIIKYLGSLILSLIWMSRFISKNHIDIIQSNTLAVLEGGFLHIIRRKPHIWHVHEIIKSPNFLRVFYRRFVPVACTKVLCVSKAVKNNLSSKNKKHNNKLVVVHNGINIEKFKPFKDNNIREELNLSGDEILVGMIGRVNNIKGQGFLLDVAREICNKHDNVSFLMVGDAFSGQEKLMEDLVEASKCPSLKGKVYIEGFRKDTPSIYNNLDIFVLPSIKPDSFPTVVLEAMSTGLPIVANVTGGVKEMVKDSVNGFLISDIDRSKMAKKLNTLIENTELRDRFGKMSRKIIEENFTSQVFHKKINRLYEEV